MGFDHEFFRGVKDDPVTMGLYDQLFEHSKWSARHSARVALSVAEMVYSFGNALSSQVREVIIRSALLHDVGKLYVSRELLNKPEALTDDEFKLLRRHPRDSYRILDAHDFSLEAKLSIAHHEFKHEGYPRRVNKPFPGVNRRRPVPVWMSVGMQMISAADIYDASTVKRPYSTSMPSLVEVERSMRDEFIGDKRYLEPLFSRHAA